MTKKLHPTLKACKCGFIGTKQELYRHLDRAQKRYLAAEFFFADHGESVLNEDDPRLATITQLEQSLKKL